MSFTELKTALADLQPYRSKQDLIEATVLQIEKDFAALGEELTLWQDETPAYTSLVYKLQDVFSTMLRNYPTRLMNVLYRIDISEQDIVERMEREEDMAVVMAQMVIDRELKKVITRMIFSGVTFDEIIKTK